MGLLSSGLWVYHKPLSRSNVLRADTEREDHTLLLGGG